MASTMKSISEAIESIPLKKEDLRKALDDLQSHSSYLASFALQWKDLEAHFESIEKSIETRFRELESKEKQQQRTPAKKPVNKPAESNKQLKKAEASEKPAPKPDSTVKPVLNPYSPSNLTQQASSLEVFPRPELKSLCEKMDAIGLRSFIIENRKDLPAVRNEIPAALRFASDPAKMVLDSLDGFYSTDPKSKGDRDADLASVRRTCVLLLEKLAMINPEIKNPIKDKAKKLAVEWKGKVSLGGENPLEIMGFLQLLAAFSLVDAFDVGEIFDLAVFVARRKRTVDLCKALNLKDRIPDFVGKLISKGKQLDAVNFVYAFDFVEKFPPVPLLKAYLKESKKIAQEIRKKGHNSTMSQNEAIAKETAAVKAVMKFVEEHELESEFPRENLAKRIAQLEQQKFDKKRTASAPAPKPQQQPLNKKPRPAAAATTTAPLRISNPPSHPSRINNPPSLPSRINNPPSQPSGVYADHLRVPSYLGPDVPYGLSGPAVVSGTLYERPGTSLVGPPWGFGASRSPTRSHLYTSEHLLGSGIYDHKALGYSNPLSGGLQYPPSYYP